MSNIINIPVWRDHRDLITSLELAHECREISDLEGGCWQVSVQRKRNLFWSIVLPYLMERVDENPEAFSQILRTMIGSEPTNPEKIQECVQYFNPFWNRSACFHNKNLEGFVDVFKKRVEKFTKCKSNKSCFKNLYKAQGNKLNARLIRAASHILQCEIIEISHHDEYVGSFSSIQYHPEKNLREGSPKIILYSKQEMGYLCPLYSFGIAEDRGSKMQKTALKKILRDVIHPKESDEIFSNPDFKSNFIGELITQGRSKEAKRLLCGPPRTMLKLLEAGFATDLANVESPGKTFALACRDKDKDLLYLLYRHFVNTSLWSQSSIRESNSCVVDTLMKLRDVLKETRMEYESEEGQDHQVLVSLTGLCAFHSFQTELSQSICHAKQKTNYFDKIPENVYETDKRKNVLSSILYIYSRNFFLGHISEKTITLYEKYFKYYITFYTLDIQAAIFFFDNCFALKENWKLPGKPYQKVEAAFARYLFLWKYYTELIPHHYPKYIRDKSVVSQPQTSSFQLTRKQKAFALGLAYLERLNLKRCIDELYEVLTNTEVDEKDVTFCIAPSEVHTLEEEPIIKDEMILLRLKHYIKLALDVDLEEEPDVGVAAIVKCFQVIGESFTAEEHEKLTLARCLLASCLNEDLKTDLKRIRNCLAHGKGQIEAARLDVESDREFFQSIQKELKSIEAAFSHIFELQSFRMKKYALNSGITATERKIEDIETLKSKTEKSDARMVREALKFNEQLLFVSDDGTESVEQGGDIPSRVSKVLNEFRNRDKSLKQLQERTNEEFKQVWKNISPHVKNHLKNQHQCLKQQQKVVKKIKYDKTRLAESKVLKQMMLSLAMLLEFVVKESDYEREDKQEHLAKLEQLKNELQCDEILAVPDYVETLVSEVLAKFGCDDNKSIEFQNGCEIHKLRNIFLRSCYLPKTTVQNILSAVPKKYLDHHDAKKKIIKLVEQSVTVPDDQIEQEISKLQISSTAAKKVKRMSNERNRQRILEIRDDYGELVAALDNCELDDKKYKTLCENFEFPDEIREELAKIVLGYVPDNKSLEYLHSRLEKLNNIIIKRYPDVNHLWRTGKSLKTREFTRDKLVSYYRQDTVLQAAVEQLILDCAEVLRKQTQMEHLWRKTQYLFSGINLRNVLAHGNPLCECVSPILDPSDFPNEIISKVFELLDDLDAVEAMRELEKSIAKDKQNKSAKEMRACFGEFVAIVNSEEDDEYKELRERIRSNNNWKCYARLLPVEKGNVLKKSSLEESTKDNVDDK